MGDFDDINIKIAVDAAGAESGLNAFSSAIDKVSENISSLGEGVNFSDIISDGAKDSISALEDLQSAIDAALGSASGQEFAVSVDISEAESNLADLGSAIDAAASAGFVVPVDADVSQAESAIDELSSMMGNIPANIDIGITADVSELNNISSALGETTASADTALATVATPFVVTAGDAIAQAKELSSALEGVATSYAKNVESAGRISLINVGGPSATDIQAIAQAGINADATINDNLAMLSKLEKKGVDTYGGLVKGMKDWQMLGEANAMTGAEMYDTTAQAMNAFGISMDGMIAKGDALTTIGQKWSIGLEGLNSGIMRSGFNAKQAGMTIEDLAAVLQTGKSAGKGPRFAMELNTALKDLLETGAKASDADFMKKLSDSLGLDEAKIQKYTDALKNANGAQAEMNKVEETGHTAWQNISADIDKATYSLKGMVVPLEPAAAGVMSLVGVGAQLAVFDAFIGGGRLKGGLDTVISKLPLIGAGAAAATPEIEGAAGALALLGGPITLAAIAAAGVAVAAYATNFGGFADNINDSISTAQDAITEFGAGNYEEAGRLIAVSISEGFGALGDLLGDVIKNLPELKADADKLTKGLKEGMKEAAKGVGEGLRSELEKYLNSAKVEVSTFIANINSKFKEGGFKTAGEYVASEIIAGINTYVFDLSGLSKNIEEGVNKGNWKPAGEQIGDLLLEGIKFKLGPGIELLMSGAEILGAGLGGVASPVSTKQKQSFISSVTKNAPTYTAVPVAPSIDTSQWKYGGPSTPQAVTVKIDAKDVTTAMAKQYAAETKGWGAAQTATFDKAPLSESMREATANWINSKNADSAATSSLTTKTKSAEKSIITYTDANKVLTDNSIVEGTRFKVGTQEYIKTLDKSGDTAKYVAEEQGAAADLTRAQSEINAKKEEQRQTELDSITKDQTAAAKKVTDANKKYADAIDKAAFDYQQSVKYGGTSEQLGSAKTTYQKKLDEITYNAGKEGVSLEGLNTSMQVGSDTANNLKTTYTNINADLKKQIGELETERQKKISSAKSGTTVDTSSIDKKISDLNAKIRENESAINSSTATVQKNTVAVKSSTGQQTASIEALRNKYDELTKDASGASTIMSDVISKMSYDDLVKNIEAYGVQVGDINQELGGTVQQLDAISQSVNDIGSTDAFTRIQNTFADLKKQFDNGSISQEQYLDGLRKASAETDTLSRSTNILKGDQREAIQQFEREIKQALRNIYADPRDTGKNIQGIGGSISKLGGVSSGASEIGAVTSKINTFIGALEKQGISTGKAAALQFTMNDAISDSMVTLDEGTRYLQAYKQVVGDVSDTTHDSAVQAMTMMDVLNAANRSQQLYNDAMQSGGISSEELAAIQAQQQVVQDALTTVTTNTVGVTGQLPPALQAVANAVNSVVSQIYAQLQTASSAAQAAVSAQQQIASLAASAGSAVGGATQGRWASSPSITISNNQFGQTTTAADMIREGLSRLSL
jgi:hypothetical protein